MSGQERPYRTLEDAYRYGYKDGLERGHADGLRDGRAAGHDAAITAAVNAVETMLGHPGTIRRAVAAIRALGDADARP